MQLFMIAHWKIRASYAEVGMAGDYTQSYYYTPAYGGGFYMGNPIVYSIAGAMAYVPYYKVCLLYTAVDLW